MTDLHGLCSSGVVIKAREWERAIAGGQRGVHRRDRRAQIERACADSGFTGVVAFRDEPGMGFAAFQLEWADGRADHDPEGSATRVAEALTAALAAEAGHAEPPINADRSDF